MTKTNNKGFSLVELIIVIAIMAILVGVLAPQYMRYVDKSRVANDRDLCDSIYNAMTAASADPDNESDRPSTTTSWQQVSSVSGGKWSADVLATLGVSAGSDLDAKLKSKSFKSQHITYSIDALGNFKVSVENGGASILIPEN